MALGQLPPSASPGTSGFHFLPSNISCWFNSSQNSLAQPSHNTLPCGTPSPSSLPIPSFNRHQLQQCLASGSGAGCLHRAPRSWWITMYPPTPPPALELSAQTVGSSAWASERGPGDAELSPPPPPPPPLPLPLRGHPLTLGMQQGLSVFCCEGPRSQRHCPACPVTDGEPGHRRRGEGPARCPWKG